MGLNSAYDTLAVELDSSAFRAIRYGADGVSAFNVAVDPAKESVLEALEAAVYSSEALTADYARTRVLVRTAAYTLALPELAAEASLIAHFADPERHTVITDPSAADICVVWAMENECIDFLRRTFRNAPLQHVLTPLIPYFTRCSRRRNNAKIFVHLNNSGAPWADIAAFDAQGRLLGLVSRPASTPLDTLYYIAALCRRCRLDIAADEINICGDALRRNALLAILPRYAANTLPMPYPAEAVANGADLTNSPLPLLV